MHPTGTLKKVLRTLTLTSFQGQLCRVVDAGTLYGFSKTGPYIPRPLFNLGPPSTGARFTPKGGAPSLYLAEDYDTALRECLQISVPNPLSPTDRTLVVYTATVELSAVLDLTDPRIRSQLGTTVTELKSPWRFRKDKKKPPTQRLGGAVASVGHIEAIRFPSTRGAGACWVILTDALTAPDFVEVNDPNGKLVERLP